MKLCNDLVLFFSILSIGIHSIIIQSSAREELSSLCCLKYTFSASLHIELRAWPPESYCNKNYNNFFSVFSFTLNLMIKICLIQMLFLTNHKFIKTQNKHAMHSVKYLEQSKNNYSQNLKKSKKKNAFPFNSLKVNITML